MNLIYLSEIALYNLLKRIPDATDNEMRKDVSDVTSSKDTATELDMARVKRNSGEVRWVY